MRATVDDVKGGARKDEGWLNASEIGEVLVEGDTLFSCSSFGNRNRNTKNGVGTEFSLVRGAVELDQEVVDVLLLNDGKTRFDEFRCNDVVDVSNGLADT